MDRFELALESRRPVGDHFGYRRALRDAKTEVEVGKIIAGELTDVNADVSAGRLERHRERDPGAAAAAVLSPDVAAVTNPGPIDLAASDGFLYAETGINGTVDEFRVGSDGTLAPLGSVDDLPPGIEGIAAS